MKYACVWVTVARLCVFHGIFFAFMYFFTYSLTVAFENFSNNIDFQVNNRRKRAHTLVNIDISALIYMCVYVLYMFVCVQLLTQPANFTTIS